MKFEIKKNTKGEYYFILKGGNHEIVATSEGYTAKQSAINTINSIKTNVKDAEVKDLTV